MCIRDRLIYNFILYPLNLSYLQTIVFILVIAALVQFVEMLSLIHIYSEDDGADVADVNIDEVASDNE